MIDVFASIEELFLYSGVKCEAIIVDKDSFLRIKAAASPHMGLLSSPPPPQDEIRISGLTIKMARKTPEA